MSQLLARIMLAIFMLPCAAVFYTVVYVVAWDSRQFSNYLYDRQLVWIIAGLVTWLFIIAYWWLLWRKAVRWHSTRWLYTLGSIAVAVLLGVIAATLLWHVEDDFALWVGTVVSPLVWLILTTFIWRESAKERSERTSGVATLTCPTCGYNLTGLQGTRCPECGTQFTVDELLFQRKSTSEADLTS